MSSLRHITPAIFPSRRGGVSGGRYWRECRSARAEGDAQISLWLGVLGAEAENRYNVRQRW